MVLSVGCSGTGLTSEQKQIAKRCMNRAEYIYENGFPDTLIWEEGEEEELYNKLYISDEEVSAPHHKFVKKCNEVNEKYNLRYKPRG